MELTLRAIWNAFNSVHSFVIHGAQLNFWFWLVALHAALALATLALGDKTVGDMLKPLRRIYSPDKEALLDGALDVVVAIPRAVLYYLALYVRAYFLLLRLAVFMYLAFIPALLTTMVLLIVGRLVFGGGSFTPESAAFNNAAMASIYISWAYWYWRLDGRRLADNVQRAWRW